MSDQNAKVVLVGDAKVGKSTWLRLCSTGLFTEQYTPTMGVEVHAIDTTSGLVLNVWDTAGQEKYGGLRDGYYIMGRALVVMFDLGNPASLTSVSRWLKDVQRVVDFVPLALIGNKRDGQQPAQQSHPVVEQAQQAGWPAVKYFEISCKDDPSALVIEPLFWLADQLAPSSHTRAAVVPSAFPGFLALTLPSSTPPAPLATVPSSAPSSTPPPPSTVFSFAPSSTPPPPSTVPSSAPAPWATAEGGLARSFQFVDETGHKLLSATPFEGQAGGAWGTSPFDPAKGTAPAFKVVLVGDGNVGKTSWLKRCRTGQFESRYVATIGVEVHPHQVEVPASAPVILTTWDTAGQEKFGGLRDGYYILGQAGIIMFDVTNRLSFKNIRSWRRDLLRVMENVPIILVGNKSDCPDWAVKPALIADAAQSSGLPYFEISVKDGSMEELQAPLVWLAQKLLGRSPPTPSLKQTKSSKTDAPEAKKAAPKVKRDKAAAPIAKRETRSSTASPKGPPPSLSSPIGPPPAQPQAFAAVRVHEFLTPDQIAKLESLLTSGDPRLQEALAVFEITQDGADFRETLSLLLAENDTTR